MKLLLDTHIFLWCLNDDKALTTKAKKVITDASEIFISSASIWEMAIKIRLNKLKIDLKKVIQAIDEMGFTALPIYNEHAVTSLALPNIHRDPFDRMLIAQAISEPLKLITHNKVLSHYSDMVLII